MNKAFLAHKTTKECVEKIKIMLTKYISNGSFYNLTKENLADLSKDIYSTVKLPKFDDLDWFNGLGIAIHDTYSTGIYLDYVNVRGDTFEAGLTFHIQDHFGLDVGDVNGKYFEYSSWFCSWFILQRYIKYGYKPFINESYFSVTIEG